MGVFREAFLAWEQGGLSASFDPSVTGDLWREGRQWRLRGGWEGGPGRGADLSPQTASLVSKTRCS